MTIIHGDSLSHSALAGGRHAEYIIATTRILECGARETPSFVVMLEGINLRDLVLSRGWAPPLSLLLLSN